VAGGRACSNGGPCSIVRGQRRAVGVCSAPLRPHTLPLGAGSAVVWSLNTEGDVHTTGWKTLEQASREAWGCIHTRVFRQTQHSLLSRFPSCTVHRKAAPLGQPLTLNLPDFPRKSFSRVILADKVIRKTRQL